MSNKLAVPLWQLIVLLGVTLTLAACDRSAFTVSTTVENAARATETALAGDRDLSTVQPFFAKLEDGANPAGLNETWGALERFAASLDNSTRVQFHSFDVVNTKVHENGGLATAGYRLHMSLLRDGEVTFSAVVTQNLALLKKNGNWTISGGDAPQLTEVQGQWPQVGR
jgi:hypothetical protein